MQKQNIISLLAAVLLAAGLGFAPLQQAWAQDAQASYMLILEKEASIKQLKIAAKERNEIIAELEKKKAETCITFDRTECLKQLEEEIRVIQKKLDDQARQSIVPFFAAFKTDAANPKTDIDAILAEIERLRDQIDAETTKFSAQDLAIAQQRCQQKKLPAEFETPTIGGDLTAFRLQVLNKTINLDAELKACVKEREFKRRIQCGNESYCKIPTRTRQITIDDYLAPTDNYIRMLNTQLGSFKATTEQAKTLQLGGPDGLLVVPGQQLFSSPANFLVAATTLALRLIGLLAFVIIIFAGFRLLISAGDDSAITRSKEMIKMAAIGLAVALMAYIIVSVVQGILYA